MSLLILAPKCSMESASKLARSVKGEVLNPFDTLNTDFREHHLVINYGCNRNIQYTNILNTPKSVNLCVNKLTFHPKH